MDGKMSKLSSGRRSSSNPVRMSTLDREDKSAGRADPKRPQKMKQPSQVDSSHIPRPRVRASSSERASIRRSTLKPLGKTPLRQQHLASQPMRVSSVSTPLYTGARASVAGSNRQHPDLPSGSRHRSPSAERASGFGAKGPRKDNRPLTDKAYQNAMLAKIDQYFYEIQQTSLLNNSGSLRPITLKIFVEATNCLVKLLDVKQDLTVLNYMDEIPKIAKKLHYPGMVTKSWLKTANTMHSWPQVLGWLSWLAELCDANDQAELAFTLEKIPFLGSGDEAETQRHGFLAMLNIYNAWNSEKTEEEAALFEQYVQEMNRQYGDIDKEIEAELELLEKVKAIISAGDRQEAELAAEIAERNRVLESLKHEEFRDLEGIRGAEESLKRAIHETNHLNVACETLEEQIEKDVVQREQMMIVVENQKMTVEKRDDIMNQCSVIQNDVKQLDKHIEDMENELYALDLKFSNTNSSLYKAVLAYNKDIVVHLGCGTGADLEALKLPETNMLCPDYIDILRMKEAELMSLKESIRKLYDRTKSAVDASANDLEALEERLRALREENNDYVAKTQEQKLRIQQIQREAKDAENKLKEEIKELANDIARIEKSMPDVEAASGELAETQDKFEAVVRRAEFVEKKMERFFKLFFQQSASHRKELEALMKKLPHGAR